MDRVLNNQAANSTPLPKSSPKSRIRIPNPQIPGRGFRARSPSPNGFFGVFESSVALSGPRAEPIFPSLLPDSRLRAFGLALSRRIRRMDILADYFALWISRSTSALRSPFVEMASAP